MALLSKEEYSKKREDRLRRDAVNNQQKQKEVVNRILEEASASMKYGGNYCDLPRFFTDGNEFQAVGVFDGPDQLLAVLTPAFSEKGFTIRIVEDEAADKVRRARLYWE